MRCVYLSDRDISKILYALECKANEYGRRALKCGDESQLQIDLWNMQSSYLGLVESLRHRFYDEEGEDE